MKLFYLPYCESNCLKYLIGFICDLQKYIKSQSY